MKKIFTLCASALLSFMSIARAESVTVDVVDYDDFDYESYDADLTYSDGVYTIANFLKSGAPLSFTFDESVGVDKDTAVKFVGDNLDTSYKDYYGISTLSGKEAVGMITDPKGNLISVYDFYIYNDGKTDYTYVMGLDKEEYGYDYYIEMYITGYDDDDNDVDLYVSFCFNKPETTDTDDDNCLVDDEATCELEYWNGSKYVSTGKAGTVTATLNAEKNAITIENFLNSGSPVTFSFETGKYDTELPITITSPYTQTSSTSKYFYLTDAAGTKLNGKSYPADAADAVDFYEMRIYNDVDYYTYATVYSGDLEGWYDICLYLQGKPTADGAYADGNDQFVTIQAYFNSDEATGIASVEANDENAPVEFYNLNGQRVNNPANGLYIRKQGSKVEKIVIR